MVSSKEVPNTRRDEVRIFTSVDSDRSQRDFTGSRGSSTAPLFTRATVQHYYHDRSMDPVVTGHLTSFPSSVSLDSISSNATTKIQLCNMAARFPEQLFEMLKSVDADNLGHIISWAPHGRCFIVHKRDEFVNEVMPKYFRQSRFTSFQRQLNLYGFNRLTVGTDRGGYYHECFLRGRPDLCQCIARTRVKGVGVKPSPNPASEPNFYTMVPCVDHSSVDRQVTHPTESPTVQIPSSGIPEVASIVVFDDAVISNAETFSDSTLRNHHRLSVAPVLDIDHRADELPLLGNNVADVDPAALEVLEADILPPSNFNKGVDPFLLMMLVDGGLFQSV